MSSNKSQDVLITFFSKVILLPLSIISSVIIARVLGPEGKGTIDWMIMLSSLSASFSSLAIGGGIIYLTRSEGWNLSKIISTSLIIAFIFGASSACLMGGLIKFNVIPRHEAKFLSILLILILIPISLGVQYLRSSLVAIDRFNEYNVISIIGGIFPPILTLLFVGFFDLGVSGAIAAFLFGQFAILILCLVILWISGYPPGTPDFSFLRPVLSYGVKSHIGTIIQKLNLRLDHLVLGFLFTSSVFGWYSLAIRLVEFLNWIPDSIGLVLFPTVASMDNEKAAETTAKLMRIDFLIVAVSGTLLAFISKPLIIILYGREFLPSFTPLLVSIPGAIALSVVKIITKYFAGIGKPEISTICTMAGFVSGGVAIYPFTKLWGMVGAALASNIGYFTFGFSCLFFFIKLSKMKPIEMITPKISDLVYLFDRITSIPVFQHLPFSMNKK